MTLWIVTVKHEKQDSHDPKHKITGQCTINKHLCSDVTGEHHSFLHMTDDNYPIKKVITHFEKEFVHVTRVEEA